MHCSNCGIQNDDNYRFCVRCGSPLTVAIPVPPANQTTPPANLQNQSTWEEPQIPNPSVPLIYPTPPVPDPTPTSYPTQPRYPGEQPATYPSYDSQPPSVLPDQGAINIWGPFAGYGNRSKHIGWLMDNRGECTDDLIRQVDEKFRERQIPNTVLARETLTARGLLVEERPYFILKRGLASVALYISRFGKDLFVSLASYLKPPISNFRVLLLIASILFFLYFAFIFPTAVADKAQGMFGGLSLFGGGQQTDTNGLVTMLCVTGPLGTLNGLALFIFLMYSLYKWMTHKDFWAGLRVVPNEFNEDDLMAMEKAVEQTVRISLDQIGLDPNDLRPASVGDANRLI
jgi:hypothetical protein